MEDTFGHQAVVAIFKTLEGESIEDFSNKLFEKWKLGSKGKDNGVLLVLSIEDRLARIEVGYGLEPVIPDIAAGIIIREELAPFLSQGQFATALVSYARKLKLIFENPKAYQEQTEAHKKKATKSNWYSRFILFLLFLFLFPAFLFFAIATRSYNNRGRVIRSRGAGWDNRWGGGFGGGSGGFGGGGLFGGGGGGLSGGGGASGRW